MVGYVYSISTLRMKPWWLVLILYWQDVVMWKESRWIMLSLRMKPWCLILTLYSQDEEKTMADYVCSKNEILKTYINPFTLPWCHLKTTNKSAKFQTLKSFSLLSFAQASERIFLKTHSIESRCDIEPENILFENILFENILFENILFASASLHLSARKFYRLGQWRESEDKQQEIVCYKSKPVHNLYRNMTLWT